MQINMSRTASQRWRGAEIKLRDSLMWFPYYAVLDLDSMRTSSIWLAIQDYSYGLHLC